MSTVELIDDPVFDTSFEILDLSLFDVVFNFFLQHPVKAIIFLICFLILLIVSDFADHRSQKSTERVSTSDSEN